jgi:hypothetical protein
MLAPNADHHILVLQHEIIVEFMIDLITEHYETHEEIVHSDPATKVRLKSFLITRSLIIDLKIALGMQKCVLML